MNESDAQESDDEGNDEWNPFVETRHGEASKPDADDMDDLDDDNDDDNDDDKEQQERGDDDDHENERWDPKQRGHGFRMPWARN